MNKNKDKFGPQINSCTEPVNASIELQKRLKDSFLSKEKLQISEYVSDLEKTLEINKQIITDLLTGINLEQTVKNLTTFLNKENEILHSRLRNAIKERDLCQAKLLVTNQIITENKSKFKTYEQQLNENRKNFLFLLKKKDESINSISQYLKTALNFLKKYYKKDTKVKEFLYKCEPTINFARLNFEEPNMKRNKTLADNSNFLKVKITNKKSLLTENMQDDNILMPPMNITNPKSLKMNPKKVISSNNLIINDNRSRSKTIINDFESMNNKVIGVPKMNENLKRTLEVYKEKNELLNNEVLQLKSKLDAMYMDPSKSEDKETKEIIVSFYKAQGTKKM